MNADGLSVLGALIAVGMLCTTWLWGRQRALTVLWVAVICFVPFWASVQVFVTWQPAAYVGLFVLALMVLNPDGRRLPLFWYDGVFALFVLMCLLPAVLTGADLETQVRPLTKWLLGYAIGRTLYSRAGADQLYKVLAVAFGAVSVFAIVEYVTQYNVFADFPMGKGNAMYQLWGGVRLRAGQWRVEAAFGNSIPLGVSLGITMPMVLMAKIRPWLKGLILVLITVTLALTLSRLGIVVAVLSVVLMLLARGAGIEPRARAAGLAGLGAALLVALPSVLASVQEAGDEAAESALYRERLWDLVSTLQPFGLASSAHRSPSGVLYFDSFRSIDNAALLVGLTYGWVPLLIMASLLLAAFVAYVKGHFNPPLIGVLAHTPALISVAFITQYEMYFFAVVGMASAAASERTVEALVRTKAKSASGYERGSRLLKRLLG